MPGGWVSNLKDLVVGIPMGGSKPLIWTHAAAKRSNNRDGVGLVSFEHPTGSPPTPSFPGRAVTLTPRSMAEIAERKQRQKRLNAHLKNIASALYKRLLPLNQIIDEAGPLHHPTVTPADRAAIKATLDRMDDDYDWIKKKRVDGVMVYTLNEEGEVWFETFGGKK